jgi:hypothetical protein
MFASEKIDNSKDTAVKEDLAEPEVNPVVEYENLVGPQTEDERKDTGGE